MSEKKHPRDGATDRLSNRDAVELPDDLSLSDSDPDEIVEPIVGKVEDLSSSSEEEESERGAQSTGAASLDRPAFRLTGGSSSFLDRSRDIFGHLDSAAKLSSTQFGEDSVLNSTFARPAPPSPPLPSVGAKSREAQTMTRPRAKRVPDYLAHPERWTRYSLEDVPETSDRKNSLVAHEFIQNLQEQRRSKEAMAENFTPSFNQNHGSSSEHRILFNKPNLASKEEGPRGSKLNPDKKKEIGLLHLEEGQEEEDEEVEEGKRAVSRHYRPWEEENRKRKWAQQEDDVSAEGKANEKQPYVAFGSSNKGSKRKNFRRAAEEDDAQD